MWLVFFENRSPDDRWLRLSTVSLPLQTFRSMTVELSPPPPGTSSSDDSAPSTPQPQPAAEHTEPPAQPGLDLPSTHLDEGASAATSRVHCVPNTFQPGSDLSNGTWVGKKVDKIAKTSSSAFTVRFITPYSSTFAGLMCGMLSIMALLGGCRGIMPRMRLVITQCLLPV